MVKRKEYTFGEILDLLDLTATATHQTHNGEEVKISDYPELEKERIGQVKALEDMLVETFRNSDLVSGGITYIRKYEQMYKHLL
jgi:hypothetical protein